jgi:hypothetical protein
VNLFYEVLQPDGLPKYYSAYDVLGWSDKKGMATLMYDSQRVWTETDDGHVRFVKNKFTDLTTTVDKKEFFLIKLKSKSI